MRRVVAIAILFIVATVNIAAAQQRRMPIDIRTEYDIDNNAILKVERIEKGFYTLILDFEGSENTAVPQLMRFDVNSDGPLVTLRPINPYKRWNFGYSSYLTPGRVNPTKVDSAFVYKLPFGSSAKRLARDLKLRVTDTTQVNFRGIEFIMNRGDTVYAARQGVVIHVTDKYEPTVHNGHIIIGVGDNEVCIQHADGTIARYGVLSKGSIPVKVGDMVYPDDPIGLVGTFDNESWWLHFAVFYQTDNLYQINSLNNYVVNKNYLDPLFETSEGNVKLKNATYYTK